MRVATRVTGGISGVGDVSLMRVDVGNEDREKVDDRRRRRPTLRAWSVLCRLDASWHRMLAPRRAMVDVSIGACSRMPRHTLQSLPRLLADPPSFTLYGLQRGTSLASWEARDDIGTLAVGSEPLGAVGSYDKPARTTERTVCYYETLSS